MNDRKQSPNELCYQSGFGNYFSTEAEPGALPIGRNSPQRAPLGLYAEQLSGSAFTAPNADNLRSWLYRILPSVRHSAYKPLAKSRLLTAPFAGGTTPPDQLRWDPWPLPKEPTYFHEGLITICGNGDAAARTGAGVHVYACNRSMTTQVMCNADGDFLILPQQGTLHITSEFGRLSVAPLEIVVIPRGIKFRVSFDDAAVRGYICENYGEHFQLPHRGPIGANGLANQRDFLSPVAWYEDVELPHQLITKFNGALWSCDLPRSPFDVVAWHGNYAPYKYDLRRFNTINTVSFDHPDPSIFTVLTSPTAIAGTANIDFVIFPPRWMVAEDTFRPPYFHRNVMSEYMGLIHGVYDAKPAGGFVPGGGSLHNCMSAHGPETAAFEAASAATLKPEYMKDTMAFMFESSLLFQTTAEALNAPQRQSAYLDCWQSLKPHFKVK